MSILVNTNSEQEEKLLIAFLNHHHYNYQGVVKEEQERFQTFIDEYNREIDQAEAEIDAGNYMLHEEVEKLFANRRKNS